MGNLCVHGGADISAKLGRGGKDVDKDAEAVELSVVDNSDGSYQLKWKGKTAGSYPVDVLINGAHVIGSPTQLIVGSAEPAVEQMTVSGLGMSKAIAGTDAQLHISVADRFGNRFEPEGNQSFPYTFGFCVSHTTRAPRPGEVDGEHYHFSTREAVQAAIANGEFIEHANVHSNIYGTSFAAVEKVMADGRICVLDIDAQGVQKIGRASCRERV